MLASSLYFPVHEDVAQVRLLTKSDMVEFYKHYLSPTSATRSKLAVYLLAQGQSAKPASTLLEKATAVLGLDSGDANAKVETPVSPSMDVGMNKDKKDAEDGEMVDVKTPPNGCKPFIITDVREFKSRLQVSAGPQPVRHIADFEEPAKPLL